LKAFFLLLVFIFISIFTRLFKELHDEGFFLDERDIALSGSCDGFQLFKQKTDDYWVVLFINNNLHPSLRVKRENLLTTMVIPGPRSPKDFNSFLFPLILELQELEGNCFLLNLKNIN
jgi:hypothetical protein